MEDVIGASIGGFSWGRSVLFMVLPNHIRLESRGSAPRHASVEVNTSRSRPDCGSFLWPGHAGRFEVSFLGRMCRNVVEFRFNV